MVMDYKNSPKIMSRIMNHILGDLIGQGVFCFIDDIIIYAETQKKHNEIVIEVC